MLNTFFRTAIRSVIKNRSSSLINIGGLAVGMAVSILIGLWIHDELSWNKSFNNYGQISQVMQHQNFNGNILTDKAISIPLAEQLRRNYNGDFKYLVLSSWTNAHVLSYQDKQLSHTGNFMGPDAPEMLTLKMISGNRSALQDPTTIFLSHSVAKALFGGADPLEKIVKLDKSIVKVTGVYQDLPASSSFSNLAFIAPWSLYANDEEVKNAREDWSSNSYQLFAEIFGDREMEKISLKIKDVKRKVLADDAKTLKPEIFLHPMSRWHLYAEFKNGVNTGGQIQYVWLFGIIGIFVLLLACINFMNLSTARSEKRMKEVGIRKTIGSSRTQLIIQFFCESVFIALLAFVGCLALVQVFLPYFNIIAGKEIEMPWRNPLFWLFGMGFGILTGLIAGSYPSLYLSSFQPVKAVKGLVSSGRGSTVLRKILVVAQFSVSLILIIGTIVVYRQIQEGKDRPVGYNREGLVIIRPYTDELHNHLDAVRGELLQTGLITDVAEGSFISKGSRTSGGLQWKGKNPTIQDNFMTFCVSPEYGKAIGWQLLAGRDFSRSLSTDSSGIILNEAAVQYMELENPIGETIGWDKQYIVIGVTKNIIMRSPYDPPVPTIYYMSPEANYLNIKIKTGSDTREALSGIEAVYKKYDPSSPFEYRFADEEYGKKFAEEERVRSISILFSILAILICCLGLFGLSLYVAEQRNREIGIRKIIGASVFSIWRMLSMEFLTLVVIALLIATPAAWYFMNSWLQNYEYRTELSWWIFAAAGSGTVAITLFTVSFQSIKAALMNPIKSLRT